MIARPTRKIRLIHQKCKKANGRSAEQSELQSPLANRSEGRQPSTRIRDPCAARAKVRMVEEAQDLGTEL
jgi:hypothetical protein